MSTKSKVTLNVKNTDTVDLDIYVDVPGVMTGHFTGVAIVRGKKEMKELGKRLRDDAREQLKKAEDLDSDVNDDDADLSDAEVQAAIDNNEDGAIEMLRELYKGFRGLPNPNGEKVDGSSDVREATDDEAWDFVTKGRLSTYLSTAALRAYFAQYNEALQKNSFSRRGR